MSAATLENSKNSEATGDSFAMGVLLMLLINMAQRLVGLARNVGFCQFLSDDELGHWAMANSFFIFALPLAVLGLPGSFGKFVEYYRVRGGLGDYILRISLASSVGIAIMVSWMLIAPESFAWFVYREPFTWQMIGWTAVTFIALTIYSFAFDIAVSIREVRVVSWMQFIQSFGFMLVGMIGLWLTHHWIILLPSFGIACILGAIPGWWVLFVKHGALLRPTRTLSHKAMWPRIIPFAAALWVTNLLTNAFELSDRYMLLHWTTGGDSMGQSCVGQYYCGRILPNLLTSLTLMLCGILLPYFSADWESNNRANIQSRMRLVLLTVSIGFTGFGFAGIVSAPILFDHVLGARYADAHAILPMSLTQCIWSSLAMIAGTYLLCAEKGRVSGIILFVGLVLNCWLNTLLIPTQGLWGAVSATTISTAVVLAFTCYSIHRLGCRLDRATIGTMALPLVLLCGTTATAVAVMVIVVLLGRTDWIIEESERDSIDDALLPKLHKLGIRLQTLWPLA